MFELLLLLLFLFLNIFVGNIYCIRLVLSDDYPMAYNVCLSAINDARANAVCTTKNIDIITRQGCDKEDTVRGAAYALDSMTALTGESDYVFVGPPCATDLGTIAEFAQIWKTPVIGYSPNLHEQRYINQNSFINVIGTSVAGLTESLAIVLNELGEKQITLVGSIGQNPTTSSLVEDVSQYNEIAQKFEIVTFLEIDETDAQWDDVGTAIKESVRTVVICTDFIEIYDALRSIDIRHLSSLRFIIILINAFPPEQYLDHANILNLIYGSSALLIAPTSTEFQENLNKITVMLPSASYEDYTTILAIYNACYSYCFGTQYGAETSVNDYRSVMNGKTVNNKFGSLSFGPSGSILSDYTVYSVEPTQMVFEVIMTIKASMKSCDNLNCFSLAPTKIDDQLWLLKDLEKPDDCALTDSCSNNTSYIIFGVIIIIFLIAAGIVYVIQRRRINIFKLTWKVQKESLKIIVNKNADQKMQRELENRKAASDGKTATEGISSRKRVFGSYAIVGTSRAEFLAFKQLKKIKWTEEQLKYLYNLKQIQNDNLAKFIGINYNDSENFYILQSLIDRSTLEDFCLDNDFNMDSTFKSAFMRDILKGVQYLHKSSIGYHGYLNSATCLIDANWVLKLAYFGIGNVVSDFFDQEILRNVEHAPPIISYGQFAWFAPEHLKAVDPKGKSPPRMVRGSPEGDMYGIGLIFYEMMFRQDPFTPNLSSIERPSPALINDIIEHGLLPPVHSIGDEDQLVKMCQACWDRDPSKRPTLKRFLECISTTYPTSKGNLVDQMMKMNEAYAEGLETVVAERSALIAQAEMQTMALLNEMLPASIAQDLKNGRHIPPMSFESATVMFVQICDFTYLMTQSKADEIISFLNNVFDQFDNVIKRHDAYKVETTGETYMVASGVPTKNEGRHTFEIAEISLEIREVSYTYVHPTKPEYKLRLKIGFHAGPIAAGVIGIRSPRYCLFGDTVNFASRMQSNCPPNQIQTSEQTAKILLALHEYKLVKRGIVHVKGKGEVNCYWLNEHLHEDDVDPLTSRPVTTAGI